MKKIKNDPLKTKTTAGTYFLCLLLAFISGMFVFTFWLTTGLNIALNSGYTASYLENERFIEKHFDEHITVRLCYYLQNFLKGYFWWIFLITLVACVLMIYLMWRATKKNSYIFMKFQSAITIISGILMILFPVIIMLLGVHSSVKLVNHQNTILFSAYIKSSCFILIAIGIVLLALAFMEEFLAATIIKNRKASYMRAQEKTHIDM